MDKEAHDTYSSGERERTKGKEAKKIDNSINERE